MAGLLDGLIMEFDKALRAVAGDSPGRRPSPSQGIPESPLDAVERRRSAALMRVNHCGEVCAQALYQGQAMASRNASLRSALQTAAREEEDHLAWTRERIAELGGRTSILNPLWYAGSLAIGLVAGKLGDAWNLGFLAETENQVSRHLDGHLVKLSEKDVKTRVIVAQMRQEESCHAEAAVSLGARELPRPIKDAMRLSARVMTASSYWV